MAPGSWTSRFTRTHPDLAVEVLNRSPLGADVSVSDYWVAGGTPGEWSREIAALPGVLKVDSLAEVGGGSIYRVTDRNAPVVRLYRRLGVPLQFPMRMRDGFVRWEVVSRRSEFESIVAYARRAAPEFRIVSLRREHLRSHLPLLTRAQQALLARAMAEGYFAVPRGISLTELARKLNRSKSSVSEAIAVVEQKLLESALRPTSLLP